MQTAGPCKDSRDSLILIRVFLRILAQHTHRYQWECRPPTGAVGILKGQQRPFMLLSAVRTAVGRGTSSRRPPPHELAARYLAQFFTACNAVESTQPCQAEWAGVPQGGGAVLLRQGGGCMAAASGGMGTSPRPGCSAGPTWRFPSSMRVQYTLQDADTCPRRQSTCLPSHLHPGVPMKQRWACEKTKKVGL